MMKRLITGIIFLTAALVNGCARPEPKYLTAIERGDVKTEMASFKTIKNYSDESIIGYIEEVVWRETQKSGWQPGTEVFRVSYIYDGSFRQLGFISSQGEARSYREDIKGEVTYHGLVTLEEGVRKILSLDSAVKFYIKEVEPAKRWEVEK